MGRSHLYVLNALDAYRRYWEKKGRGLADVNPLIKSFHDVKKGDVIYNARSGRVGIVVKVRPDGIVYDTLYLSRTKLVRQKIRKDDIGWVVRISTKIVNEAIRF